MEKNLFIEYLLPLRGITPDAVDVYRRYVRNPGPSRLPMLAWTRDLPIADEPADVVEVVETVAGRYDAIGLRIVAPFPTDHVFPVIGDPGLIRRIKRRLADTGVKVFDVEAIWLTPQSDVSLLEHALDLAVELGAGYVLTVGNDPDRGRLSAKFARLCAAANLRGLRVMLEFIPYSHIRTLEQAVALLDQVKLDNAGVLVDALHLSRSGGHPRDIAGYDPALFSYMQLCDAPAALPGPEGVRREAREARLYPGEGGLRLADFVAAFPSATPIAIEAPDAARNSLPPAERATLAASCLRRLLEAGAP